MEKNKQFRQMIHAVQWKIADPPVIKLKTDGSGTEQEITIDAIVNSASPELSTKRFVRNWLREMNGCALKIRRSSSGSAVPGDRRFLQADMDSADM